MRPLATVIFSAAFGITAALVYFKLQEEAKQEESQHLMDELSSRIQELENKTEQLANRERV